MVKEGITKEEIINHYFDVAILNFGKEGDVKCYKVYNEILGELIIDHCLLNANPDYIPNAEYFYNGTTESTFSDGTTCNFFVTLSINSNDSSKGQIFLRC